MGEPKIYIFYPDTKEISYFGIPKTYKDKIDENRYKVIRNKNSTVEIKEIRKKTSKSKKWRSCYEKINIIYDIEFKYI